MPNTIADNLSRLISARSNIASAIISKGGSVGANDGFEAFPAAISAIPAGGYNFDITQEEWDTIVAINNQTISGRFSLSGVTKIGNCMFQSCSSLEEVDFPNCSFIGSSAFQYCTSLQSVSFSACTSISSYAFQSCNSLQSVNFPSCIFIGFEAFQSCNSLQSVSFPSCTIIDGCAFSGCSSLQSISFPNCTSIGQNAFQNFSSLQSVSFPICSNIGSGAFVECVFLSAIYLLSSRVCTLTNSDAFNYTPMSLSSYLGYFGSIYVPSSLVASYKTATNWTYYADRIVGV